MYQTRIEELEKERQSLIEQVNQKIAYLTGQIDLLKSFQEDSQELSEQTQPDLPAKTQ